MSNNKLNFTARENEVLALAWQCFQTDPRYAHSSAQTTLAKLKARMKQYVQNISNDNPTPLAKGSSRKKRAAKDTDEHDDEETLKPKKRAKKMTKGGELAGEGVKVKSERENKGFYWGVGGVGGDEEAEEV